MKWPKGFPWDNPAFRAGFLNPFNPKLPSHVVARRGVEYGAAAMGMSLEETIEELFPQGPPEWIGSRNPDDFNP